MKPQMRRAGLFAATLMTVAAAFWGAAPAIVAGLSPEQAAPAAGSPPARTTPPKELTLEERADIFMARKNYADAADYYYRALKQSSFKDPVVWNKLGIAFQQQSKFRSARKAYANATRVDKNFAEAWNNIGTVYFMEKKYGKSVKYYQRAIELKGDNAAFHMNLGTSYYHLKKFDQAVEEYRTALGIDPNVVVAGVRQWGRWSTPAGQMWNSISTWPKPSLPSGTRRMPCATSGAPSRMVLMTRSGLTRTPTSRRSANTRLLSNSCGIPR